MLYPNGEFTLGLSKPVKPHKPPEPALSRERRGKAQTTYSKRMVRNCVARLEKEHGRQNIAFVTYTLPDLDDTELVFLAQEWGEVTRQLKQAIERDLERAGIKPEVVYVTEIQEKRYQKTGAVVPHVHAVFQSRKNRYKGYAISRERNTQLWNRVISNVLGRKVEIPSGARIEQIKKSAERYLSKYMSKGGDLVQKVIENKQGDLLPKAWWGASYSLRRWVKDNIKIFTEEVEQFIKAHYKQFQENINQSPFSWLYTHIVRWIEPHGEEIEKPVCVMGKVRPEWMNALGTRMLMDCPMSWEW